MTAICWMIKQKVFKIREEILIDESKLSKIITYLELMMMTSRVYSNWKHFSTLIIVSFDLIDVWITEFHNNYFDRDAQLVVFYNKVDFNNNIDAKWKKYWKNFKSMCNLLCFLNSADSNFAQVIVLTLYTMWSLRIIIKMNTLISKRASQIFTDKENVVKNENEINNTKQFILDFEKLISQWSENIRFDKVMMNETHTIKNVKFKANKMINLLSVNYHWFITTISMFNKSLNMNEFLTILHQKHFDNEALSLFVDFVKVYNKTSRFEDINLHVLSLTLWQALFREKKMINFTALIAFSRIFNRILLRRVMRVVVT